MGETLGALGGRVLDITDFYESAGVLKGGLLADLVHYLLLCVGHCEGCGLGFLIDPWV